MALRISKSDLGVFVSRLRYCSPHSPVQHKGSAPGHSAPVCACLFCERAPALVCQPPGAARAPSVRPALGADPRVLLVPQGAGCMRLCGRESGRENVLSERVLTESEHLAARGQNSAPL